jgi:drug/metabolite transporter (DMT)-like permease
VIASRTDHRRGLALTITGVLVLSPDALFLRLLELDPWTIVFWRGLLTAAGLAVGLAVFGEGGLVHAFRAIGAAGVVLAVLWAGNAIFFIVAITHTTVANTLVIIAAAPMIAAALSHLFLREPVEPETWAATVLAFLGIAVVVWDGLGRGRVIGDAAALATACFVAGTLIVLRRARSVNMVPATALGGLFAAVAVAGIASPFAVNAEDALVLGVTGLVVLPIAFGLITLGPRYLPAPEVSLLMLLETVLGPILVWLVLGEGASIATLWGGAIVVVTLGAHALIRLRNAR